MKFSQVFVTSSFICPNIFLNTDMEMGVQYENAA